MTFKQNCNWQEAVDIGGLSEDAQRRIREVGLNQWMDEIAKKPPKVALKPKEKVEAKSPPGKKTKAFLIAMSFLGIAKTNKDIVTYDQAKAIHPAYPSDCAYYAKKLGADVVTDRKNKIFKVKRYP
jgi:hypothetical protein